MEGECRNAGGLAVAEMFDQHSGNVARLRSSSNNECISL
jgi:hypothetical protein